MDRRGLGGHEAQAPTQSSHSQEITQTVFKNLHSESLPLFKTAASTDQEQQLLDCCNIRLRYASW